MFYTVTLPATLWFFDKAKQDNRILFIAEIVGLNEELGKLNEEARRLEGIITHNIKQIAGE